MRDPLDPMEGCPADYLKDMQEMEREATRREDALRAERDEARDEIERLRDLCSMQRIVELRAKVERLTAAVKEAARLLAEETYFHWYSSAWNDQRVRWLAEHGKEAGDE